MRSGSLPPPLEPILHLGERLEAVGGFFGGRGVMFCFQLLCSSWGHGRCFQVDLTAKSWLHSAPVALLSLNSQTPHSTNRASSGKAHPFHLAYFLSVFLFVSGQGISPFTSSEGFVLQASVGPLSCNASESPGSYRGHFIHSQSLIGINFT